MDEGHLCLADEELLLEEVLTGVGCEREFGQADDFDAFALGLNDERFNLLNVVLAVGHLDQRNGRSDFYKSVIHCIA